MSEVAVCPRCEGEKQVYNARSGQMESCPTCSGTGVKWRDKPEEAGEQIQASDHLDLTFRP